MEGTMQKRIVAALLLGLMIVFAGETAARLLKSEHSFLPLMLQVPTYPICTPARPPASILITSTAGPEPGSTPRPTYTPTPKPSCVSMPVLFDIINEDNRDSYFVTWSSVALALHYRLEVNRNHSMWTTAYEGPATGITKQNVAEGRYCYRVSAFNGETYTRPSAEKCTSVGSDSIPNS
jgi:hypothetical protein